MFVGGGGLARFMWDQSRPKIIKIPTLTEITQREHTFAVRGFDPTYRTSSHLLRYEWTVSQRDLFGAKNLWTRRTNEPYLTVPFAQGGAYTIQVLASDHYGWPSNTEVFDVKVALPRKQFWWESIAAKVGVAAIPMLYLILLLPLIALYPRFSWVRSLVNSGVFTKFPIVHRLLLNTQWARRRLFALYCTAAIDDPGVTHYIDQSVFPLSGSEPLPIGSEENLLDSVAKLGRFSLILGRSGTGKSVLMTRIRNTAAARFGQADLPVLVNAPTHLAGGETLVAAVKIVLRRYGKIELPDRLLDFLIGKGGFLILVDSLNECPQAARELVSFVNADANNPSLLLDALIERSGAVPLALVAYAIKTKSEEQPPLPLEVRDKYSEARLREDVRLTPAA